MDILVPLLNDSGNYTILKQLTRQREVKKMQYAKYPQ